MSTNAPPPLRSLAALLAAALAGCAAPPAGTQVGRFSQVRFGASAAPAPPRLRPQIAAPDVASPVEPVSLSAAQARMSAYLERSGFALEQRPDGAGELISATRMGGPVALAAEATCALEAMRRPTISSTELTVRVAPAPGGVQLQVQARFTMIDTKIISGDLARETCRSRGVLEGAVRAAALGG